jgi:hypothetical protein
VSKNQKTAMYLVAHFGMAYLVTDELQRRGKAPNEATMLGHLAGGLAGLAVISMV